MLAQIYLYLFHFLKIFLQDWENDLVHVGIRFQIVIIMGNPKTVKLLNQL